MIVVCGIASERPVAVVTAALDRLGLPYTMLHQRRFADTVIDVEVVGAEIRGRLVEAGRSIDCSAVTGIFNRLTDWRVLPETRDASEAFVRDCRSWHRALVDWIDIAPGCVMNRASALASNRSKPYQAQLVAQAGFAVPETLVTDDPELVREFRVRHGRVIYKSSAVGGAHAGR